VTLHYAQSFLTSNGTWPILRYLVPRFGVCFRDSYFNLTSETNRSGATWAFGQPRQTSQNAESLWAPSIKAAALRTVFQAVLLTVQPECQQAVPRAGLRASQEQASSQQELPQRLKRQTAPKTPLPLPPWHYLWPPSGFPDIAPTVCGGLACQGYLHGQTNADRTPKAGGCAE
jgi:hypothetical protein